HRTARRLRCRHRRGRPLLRSLLHPIDSAVGDARGTVLRATLVSKDPTALLAAASADHMGLARPHRDRVFVRALAGAGSATQTIGGWPIFVRAFCAYRQDFRLGPVGKNLS